LAHLYSSSSSFQSNYNSSFFCLKIVSILIFQK
jgi:hypothetical protein